MRLRESKSVEDLGKWLLSVGITPSENKDFGGVGSHSATSLHFQVNNKGTFAPDKQGNLAIDVNDRSVSDDNFAPGKIIETEKEALTVIYHRILRTAEEEEWPMDEMFFDRFGFIVEQGFDVNHPIEKHEDHLHIGFQRHRF